MCSTSSVCLNTLRPDKKWKRAPPRRSPKPGEHGQVVGVRAPSVCGKAPGGVRCPCRDTGSGIPPHKGWWPSTAQHHTSTTCKCSGASPFFPTVYTTALVSNISIFCQNLGEKNKWKKKKKS